MPLGGNLFDDSVFGVDGFCCGEQELLAQHLAMLLDWKDIDLGMQMVHSSHFQTSSCDAQGNVLLVLDLIPVGCRQVRRPYRGAVVEPLMAL